MNLLLVFLLGIFAIAVATADRVTARPRAPYLIAICVVVAIGFTARRII